MTSLSNSVVLNFDYISGMSGSESYFFCAEKMVLPTTTFETSERCTNHMRRNAFQNPLKEAFTLEKQTMHYEILNFYNFICACHTSLHKAKQIKSRDKKLKNNFFVKGFVVELSTKSTQDLE